MKVYFDTIGCRLNQSEIEKYASQFRAAGHEVVVTAAEADLVVVNTCTVTAKAASDSRQKVRQAAHAGDAEIVLTGCWATLEPQNALNLPHVMRVVPNLEKDHLALDLLQAPAEEFDLEPLARQPLPGLHRRTRAFVKVQDGCDNFCTFCITRLARGEGRSVPLDDVLADLRYDIQGGTKEVVLSGVNLGSWGCDLNPRQQLADLIRGLLEQGGMRRLRLSSLEPWDVDEDFFHLWQDERLCKHLHLPLQSGCAATLKRMARKITPASYARLVAQARQAVPEIAITTDLIIGFPGEDEAEFEESLAFVRGMEFAGGHVFAFSPRPGTTAEKMKGQAPLAVCKQRSAILRAAVAESAERYRSQFVGCEADVLWESPSGLDADGWRLEGLTDNYLRVSAVAKENLWNRISRVRLERVEGEVLRGKILDE